MLFLYPLLSLGSPSWCLVHTCIFLDAHLAPPFYIYSSILPIKKNSLFCEGFSVAWNGSFVDKKRGGKLFFTSFGQFGRNKLEAPLKGCNALSNILRTPLFLIYACRLLCSLMYTSSVLCSLLLNGSIHSHMHIHMCVCIILFGLL